MHKKIISLGLTAVITANMVQSNLVGVFAAEVNTSTENVLLTEEKTQDQIEESLESIQEQESTDDKETVENKSNQVSVQNEVTRTVTINTKTQNTQYGKIEGINEEGKIVLNSKYENVTETTSGSLVKTTTYKGQLVSCDDEVQIVVKPKDGYEFDNLKLLALKTQAASSKEFMTVQEKDDDTVIITIKALTSESWTKSSLGDNTNKNINIDIKLSKKSNTQKITTEIEGEGSITTDEDLVFEDGGFVISKGSTHTFNLEPAQGMEVKSATLNDNPIPVKNGQVSIGEGHLKVVFGETATATHNLNVNIKGQGKVVIANQDIESNTDVSLNEGQSYRFVVTPQDGYYVKSVKLDGVELNDYKIENIDKDLNLEVVFAEKMDTTIEVGNLKVTYDGKEKTLPYKVIDADGNVLEENNVTFTKKNILGINTKFNPVNVGTYDFTISYKGDDTHNAAELTDTFEITKCKPKVSVKNKTVTYNGNAVGLPVTVTPDCGYITVYTGVNVKVSPKIYVDLNLGNDVAATTLKNLLSSVKINNVGDLVKFLKNSEGVLGAIGIDVSQVVKVLEIIPSNTSLAFSCPDQPGAYLGTAVVVDSNANTAIGMGTLLMIRETKKVAFTDDSLANGSRIKYGAEYKHEAYYEGTTSKAKIMYSGITNKGVPYFSSKQPTQLGSYTAVAYSFDDLEYKVALAARTFTIGREESNIEITSGNKNYDGKSYEPTTVVTNKQGEIIENAEVSYTYYKGAKKLKSAPTEVGTYVVRAKYNSTNEYFASTTIKTIKIEKAELTITADNVSKYVGEVDPELTYTIEGLADTDNLNVELTREAGEEVGEYKITPSCDKNDNYNMTFVDGVLTIKEKEVTPEQPEVPEVPEQPEQPEQPDQGGDKEDTDKPETPDQGGDKDDTEKPGQPDQGGDKDDTEKPGQPDQGGDKDDTDKPGQPDQGEDKDNIDKPEPPQTSDASIAGYVGTMLASIAGLFAINRRRKED